jgi:hypothetical protein
MILINDSYTLEQAAEILTANLKADGYDTTNPVPPRLVQDIAERGYMDVGYQEPTPIIRAGSLVSYMEDHLTHLANEMGLP